MTDSAVTQPDLSQADSTDVQPTNTQLDINNELINKRARNNLYNFLLDHGLLTLALLLITLGNTLFLSWFGAKQANK